MTRYFFVILVMALIGVAIVVKAGITMFAERQYWQDVADRFVKENVTVKPNRGNIISSDGKLMASSLPEYRIYMDFMSGEKDEKRRKKDQARRDSILNANMDSICIGLNKIFPDKSVAQFKAHLKKGRQAKSRNYLIYPKRISYIQYKEVKRLPVFCLNRYKGGFKELAYNQRKKPLAARTLGDVYADTAKGARNGIELAFDTILKGRNGLTHREKVMNKYLNIVDVPPVDGCDLLTTIDVGMQDICEKALVDKLKELNASVGVVVLMEVATGEVKAIVNMMQGKDGEYYEMRNNAISDMLEPGSTFKTASIMVALEDGKITPDYVVDTGNGQMPMHGRVMKDHNWHRGGYGKLTVTEILGVSSNVGTSYIIDHFYGSNPQKFVDGLKRMSIDQPLHLQIAGEGKPNIRGPKERSYFSKTALPWMSIGYETQVPPMNIVTFYNAIANKGVMVRPKFVKAAIKDGEIVKEYPTEVINPKICSDKTLADIQMILRKVVGEGLAKPAGSKQFHVSGKTGTAQISQGAAGYKTGRTNYLVSFCGYFPSEDPKYSMIVSIQKPGLPASGGLMAGSVFSRIAERVYAKDLRLPLTNAIDTNSVVIPNVKAGEMREAQRVLEELNIQVQGKIADAGKEVWGNTHLAPQAVVLESRSNMQNFVPSVIGMGAKDAVYLLESKGLKVHLVGVGKVKSQSIANGSIVRKGQTVTLTLK